MSIKVAIIGVGNCAKSLVEGVAYYSQKDINNYGLMHQYIGHYQVKDIEFVAAFDVDDRKVGLELSEAISAIPNNTKQLSIPLDYNVIVKRGPTFDSIIPELRKYFIQESKQPSVNIVNEFKKSKTDIVVNFLPTGSNQATYAYAEAALSAGCHFINCIPTVLARNQEWQKRFESKDLILIGDDVKSQCGATIVNRLILSLFGLRGIKLLHSEQINFGGNADHFNLQYRPEAKESTKEESLSSVLIDHTVKPNACMVFTQQNYDHKRAEIKVNGEIFGGAPVSIKVTLDDEDSPNSAGVVVDAIRATKVLSDKRNYAEASNISSFLMKAPPKQFSEEKAALIFNQIVET